MEQILTAIWGATAIIGLVFTLIITKKVLNSEKLGLTDEVEE